MDLYIEDFLSGIYETLHTKYATDFSVFENNTAIFPTHESQVRWQYAHDKDNLYLHDGASVHVFDFSNKQEQEAFPSIKHTDSNFSEFNKLNKKSAQVHRSNPSMLYITLHDGTTNPTYTFRHEAENSWRIIPKSKKETVTKINKQAFFDGLTDKQAEYYLLDTLLKNIDYGGRKLLNGAMLPGTNIQNAVGIGLGAGALYDLAKRNIYNTAEENEAETLPTRAARYIIPAAGLGLLGGATKSLFPEYYKHYPFYTA